jgi:hypothetical protein
LEIKQFVEIREKEVYGVLVDDIALGESSSVFLGTIKVNLDRSMIGARWHEPA